MSGQRGERHSAWVGRRERKRVAPNGSRHRIALRRTLCWLFLAGIALFVQPAWSGFFDSPRGSVLYPTPDGPRDGTQILAVMPFQSLGPDQPAWIGAALRYVVSARLRSLAGGSARIVAPELVDRTRESVSLDDLAAARSLGVGKYVTGTWWVEGDSLHLVAWIVDVATGEQAHADVFHGDRNDPAGIERILVPGLLAKLALPVPDGGAEQPPTNTSVDALGLLLEAEGVRPAEPAAELSPPPSTTSPPTPGAYLLPSWLVARAYADDGEAEIEIRSFLEAYRRAHEEEDVDALADLYVSFAERQRDALGRYFATADGLRVELADVQIEIRSPTEARVSYSRRDRFVDRRDGRNQRLEVQLVKDLVFVDDTWRFAP